MPRKFKANFSDRVVRKPKIKWEDPKRKSGRKKHKHRKRLCERCKRHFEHDMLVVHHKENVKIVKIPRHRTEGMGIIEFGKLYSDKRKRPVQDKRDSIMVVCKECYKEICDG